MTELIRVGNEGNRRHPTAPTSTNLTRSSGSQGGGGPGSGAPNTTPRCASLARGRRLRTIAASLGLAPWLAPASALARRASSGGTASRGSRSSRPCRELRRQARPPGGPRMHLTTRARVQARARSVAAIPWQGRLHKRRRFIVAGAHRGPAIARTAQHMAATLTRPGPSTPPGPRANAFRAASSALVSACDAFRQHAHGRRARKYVAKELATGVREREHVRIATDRAQHTRERGIHDLMRGIGGNRERGEHGRCLARKDSKLGQRVRKSPRSLGPRRPAARAPQPRRRGATRPSKRTPAECTLKGACAASRA